MATGFGSYEIARSGLFVNERALNVVGHNISNLDTPGYVRQQTMIVDLPYRTIHGNGNSYQTGLGACVQQIRQIRNIFLDNMYRKESTLFGYWEAKLETIQDIEVVLGDPMEKGLQSAMNQFWDSWHELSKEPESRTARAMVRQRGESLVNTINHIGEQLEKLQRDLKSEIAFRVDEINNITEAIAELNLKIQKYEAPGGTANDYRDERNNLVDRLSRLIDVRVSETQEGWLYITTGGYSLLNRDRSTKLYLEQSDEGGIWYEPKLEGYEAKAPIVGGTLKGLLESRNEIEEVKDMLNTLVLTMVNEVNNLQKVGKTMGNPPQTGEDFFTVINPGRPEGLGNIKLNDTLSDLNNIVTSQSGESGDNIIALAVANIRNNPLIHDETGTLGLDEYYQMIILKVAQKGNEAFNIAENQLKLLQAADANREAVSGVSLDEELTYMMKFKFAYDASSRVLNVIDNMVDVIINRMGIVGR